MTTHLGLMALQHMQIRASDERPQMQLVLSLQRDQEHVVVGHLHGLYRHAGGHRAEQGEVIHVPRTDGTVL